MKRFISLDIDGVLTNTSKTLQYYIYLMYGVKLTDEDLVNLNVSEIDHLRKQLPLNENQKTKFLNKLFSADTRAFYNYEWLDIFEQFKPFFDFIVVTNRSQDADYETRNQLKPFLEYIKDIYYYDKIDPKKVLRIKKYKPILHVDDNHTIVQAILESNIKTKPVFFMEEPSLKARQHLVDKNKVTVADLSSISKLFKELV